MLRPWNTGKCTFQGKYRMASGREGQDLTPLAIVVFIGTCAIILRLGGFCSPSSLGRETCKYAGKSSTTWGVG
ncbi:hypothetical protein BDV38DRAFT_262763 [Aspergillus pseudotamarii]|uniref:Uncharacterized protein n=1 Tax=Aspergillus pseudotamarii TaxID=132259 RepID=A0A5N6SDY2_ASPPS|nr:uncharacterized protein BDV38DRAFT_262763 [Aspergillus pseudotamarii]KAE8131920.1 hypothetical protein BDV38DRAFT_262763 [Aspergillus pseudotamarii]